MGRVTHLVNLSGIVPLPIIMTSNLPLNSTSFSSLFYGFEASIHFFFFFLALYHYPSLWIYYTTPVHENGKSLVLSLGGL